ncbi:MAG: peptide chain release factor 3, partial [Actinobacteria bacterium]|nr:peptide chain release factor 3 [Actinomycetota bacterium]
ETTGDVAPVLAAVGRMQFEVFAHRLEHEFGAAVEISPTADKVARRTDAATAEHLRSTSGARVLTRTDGVLLALFTSPRWLERVESDHPDWTLDPIVVD